MATLSNIPIFYRLGRRRLDASAGGVPLFTENETTASRVFGSEQGNRNPHVKDAFHCYIISGEMCINCVALALVDSRYAMDQLWVLLFEQFQHPNGQLPAYEWDFSDTNPPVHAWAVWRVYNMARVRTGRADRDFLERCFHKLLINFAWWVNKVDGLGQRPAAQPLCRSLSNGRKRFAGHRSS